MAALGGKDMKRDPPTGLNIAVIGGGISGLTFGIECIRKGHTVTVYERKPEIGNFGDLIGITRSAQRGFLNWPGFIGRLLENAMQSSIGFYKFDGYEIATLEDTDTRNEGIQSMALWRSELHQQLYNYAIECGVPVIFNKGAAKFFDSGKQGGVRFEDGQEVLADLVVAADGVGSQSAFLTVNDPETPSNSGYAIYRASFPIDVAMQDPLVAEHWKDYEGVQIHLAENCHLVTAKNNKTNRMCWMLTHKDIHDDAVENWNATCPALDALDFAGKAKGWAPYVEALIRQTPNNECVNWKLMWRSPRQPWFSPGKRVLQIGDACHAFIPTSGSGAVMAMEDGFSLAACLQMASKETIPLAIQVHAKLRFERTAFAQKLGFDTREVYHHPSWELFMENPEAMAVGAPWILKHNAEQYAYENYGKCLMHILHGTPFENTNGPKGIKYTPWTIAGVVAEAAGNHEKKAMENWGKKKQEAAKL